MSGSVSFATKAQNPANPGVWDISPSELREKLGTICLVDVREPNEFTGELGHISDAQLIPLGTLSAKLETLPPDRTIVFVCRSGGRSGRAASLALDYGLSDVYNMAGGMLRWNELQFETER